MRRSFSAVAALLVVAAAGCNAVYYSTMSKLGREKRDILVQRVKDSKKDQEQTKEKLKTTMESFQELTGFQGGSLEQSYKKLNSEYEHAKDQADKLHNRIESIDQVSKDLFSEWQKELDQMDNPKLKRQSAALLKDSRDRQAVYMKAMRATEAKMTPVLNSFRDQVLFLKHNLNARAIGSLKGTSAKISTDVDGVVKSLDSSIQEADKLIASLSSVDGDSAK